MDVREGAARGEDGEGLPLPRPPPGPPRLGRQPCGSSTITPPARGSPYWGGWSSCQGAGRPTPVPAGLRPPPSTRSGGRLLALQPRPSACCKALSSSSSHLPGSSSSHLPGSNRHLCSVCCDRPVRRFKVRLDVPKGCSPLLLAGYGCTPPRCPPHHRQLTLLGCHHRRAHLQASGSLNFTIGWLVAVTTASGR